MSVLEINSVYSRINQYDYDKIQEIEKVSHTELNYNEFFSNYMLTNRPLIIAGIATDWHCSRHWIESSNTVNFTYLKQKIPTSNVPVADCSRQYQNSHVKADMDFFEFLDYWEVDIKTQRAAERLYLKDWHLRNEMPDYQFYQTPNYFGSDWLNEYLLASGKDDYRFVYMGPKGTWTPFHSDVLSSFSWSTNIVGVKKWIFLPPGEEVKLLDLVGNLPFSINESSLQHANVQHFVIHQMAGETVFVPSGWHHQVWNEQDTISVNHNWLNGCNVAAVLAGISDNYSKVLKEIDDCKDMDGFKQHCQVMLKASYGIDFMEFLELLHVVGRRRKLVLNGDSRIVEGSEFQFGLNHCIFDINAIVGVVQKLEKQCTENVSLKRKCVEILELLGRDLFL